MLVVLQMALAALAAVLIAVPAHFAGHLGIDAVLNWQEGRKDQPIHHGVVLATGVICLAIAVWVTFTLARVRAANFEALAGRNPDGVFAAVDPGVLETALLAVALAGVVGIVIMAAKRHAGHRRADLVAERRQLTRRRKKLEERADGLAEAIAEAERKYDVLAEREAAGGMAQEEAGRAALEQYRRAYRNTQWEQGREPTLPDPEPEPNPAEFYEPIAPTHAALPAPRPERDEQPKVEAERNGHDPAQEADVEEQIKRLVAENNNHNPKEVEDA